MKANLSPLTDFLSADKARVESLISTVDHTESMLGLSASTRMHFLKFDGNGKPLVKALAELMHDHAIDYCLNARERPKHLTAKESMKLAKEARKLFIHPPATEDDPDQTGEAGELLLYLLIEAVLGAPQVVAKMELKTNPKLEVNGSDGIHMMWNPVDSLVEIFFGEAKLYQDLGGAMAAALNSIDKFHKEDILRHEFLMVTKQFKYAHEAVKSTVTNLLESGTPTEGVRVNHACLIGYNWKEYEDVFKAPASKRLEDLQKRYLADATRIHDLCRKKFESFKSKHVTLTIFFIPFEKVQDLRDAFNDAMK